MTEKEEQYQTIRMYLEGFLDDNRIRVFPMYPTGNFYASTRKPNGDIKKPVRGTIAFPTDGSLGNTDDLRFLRNWNFTIIAIPKEVIEEAQEKVKD